MTSSVVKTWGTSYRSCSGPVQIEILTIKKGGFSSVHRHDTKHNGFVLISGKVDILTAFDAFRLRNCGDFCFVSAGTLHQFLCVDDALLVEFYYNADSKMMAVDPVEIVRESLNGLAAPSEVREHYDNAKEGQAGWFRKRDEPN